MSKKYPSQKYSQSGREKNSSTGCMVVNVKFFVLDTLLNVPFCRKLIRSIFYLFPSLGIFFTNRDKQETQTRKISVFSWQARKQHMPDTPKRAFKFSIWKVRVTYNFLRRAQTGPTFRQHVGQEDSPSFQYTISRILYTAPSSRSCKFCSSLPLVLFFG